MQACVLVSDEIALASRLGISVSDLVSYLLGKQTIPVDVFLKAADIVLHAHEKRVEVNGKWLEDFLNRHRRR